MVNGMEGRVDVMDVCEKVRVNEMMCEEVVMCV